MSRDLVVELRQVRVASAQLRAAAQGWGQAEPVLATVSEAVPTSALDAAVQDLAGWAARVDELCARVVRHAEAAQRACEALVDVDQELAR